MSTPVPLTMLDQMREFHKRIGFLERRPAGGGALPIASTPAELAALVASYQPSPTRPLVVQRTGDGPAYIAVTFDGVTWSRTWPTNATWQKPNTGAWVKYDLLHHGCGYAKTSEGIVVLTGVVRGGVVGTTPIFTLPVGYRPSHNMVFSIIHGGGAGDIRVMANGEVRPVNASTSWTSLEGIMFPAAGVATWTAVTSFGSGWASYHTVDSSYPPLAYWRDPQGRVWFNGLARQTSPTTLGADSLAFNVPHPSLDYTHFAGVGSGAFAPLDARPAGANTSLYAKQGTVTNWVSFQRAAYVSSAVRTDWRPNMAYGSGWVSYDAALFPEAKYMVFGDGIVFSNGLLKNGTMGGVTVPQIRGARADTQMGLDNYFAGRMIYPTISGNALGRLDTYEDATTGKPWATNVSGNTVWFSHAGFNYLIGG